MEAKADITSAINLLRKAATLDPENKGIQNVSFSWSHCKFYNLLIFFQIFQELSRLILKSKKEARNEKDMYQNVLYTRETINEK